MASYLSEDEHNNWLTAMFSHTQYCQRGDISFSSPRVAEMKARSQEEREERRRRLRAILPLLVATGFIGTAFSYYCPHLPIWLFESLIATLMGGWVFGIWYVSRNPHLH